MAAQIESFYADLGKRIRDARTKLRLTQQQLGALLAPKTTRVSVANVESGKQRVLAHTLVQFAEALRVSPSDLLPAQRAGALPTNHDIAQELVAKAGLSKAAAKKVVESPRSLPEWEDKS